jgi:PEP-CTERM motif
MKKLTLFVTLALALTAAVATPALAGTITFTGTTTGGPTYNRPFAGIPPTGLSGVGTAVRYSVNAFTVSQSGGYNFLNTTAYDSFLGIHAGSFNPANGLQNAIAYSDDFVGLDGGFTALALLAGVSYFAVSSGFENTDFGAYSLNINGPGTITGAGGPAVPEPASWALMLTGFGLAGAAMRRRQSVRVTYA